MRLTAEAGSVSAFHHLRRRILILEAASFSAADKAPPQPLLTHPTLPLSLSLFGSLFAPLDPVNHADHALEAANYVIKLSNCSAPRRRFGRVSASSCLTASLLHFPQVANQFYASFYGCLPLSPRLSFWNRRCGWPTPLAIHLELSGNSWTSCAGGILSDATRCNAARHIIAHPNPWYASQGAWPTAATLCAPEEFKSLCCKIPLSLSTFWVHGNLKIVLSQLILLIETIVFIPFVL